MAESGAGRRRDRAVQSAQHRLDDRADWDGCRGRDRVVAHSEVRHGRRGPRSSFRGATVVPTVHARTALAQHHATPRRRGDRGSVALRVPGVLGARRLSALGPRSKRPPGVRLRYGIRRRGRLWPGIVSGHGRRHHVLRVSASRSRDAGFRKGFPHERVQRSVR